MKLIDIGFALARGALFGILGWEFARAGILFFSVQGAVVWGALMGVALLDATDAVRAYKSGREEGIRRAVVYMVTHGWRKGP